MSEQPLSPTMIAAFIGRSPGYKPAPSQRERLVTEDIEEIREATREALRETDLTAGNLIPLLQKVQRVFGYLPREAIIEMAALLDMPSIDVYSTASFYHQFRFNKPGRRSIKVCTGTACHSRGSGNLIDLWQDRLCICKGQTTPDGEFDLEGVACVGCCVMAPVVIIDDDIRGKSKPADVDVTLLSSGWHPPHE